MSEPSILADTSALGRISSTRSRSALRARMFSIAVLVFGAIVIMIPFFWMISTSLKAQGNVYLYPPQWIPNPQRWTNFSEVFDQVPFLTFAKNTGIIVFFVIIGTLLSCSISAYGFARLRAPGRNIIFMAVLATMMLPGAVTLVPTYIAFNKLGWINSFLPLIVPAFFGSPFYVFLLRQFYLSIPKELEESCRVDGASSLRIWRDVMLPLTKPALATVAVFTFFATYNDFFGPLIYLNDESKQTLAVGLSYFTGSPTVGPQMHLLMAMTLLTTIPSLVVFLLAQRYFVQSIVTTGLKGWIFCIAGFSDGSRLDIQSRSNGSHRRCQFQTGEGCHMSAFRRSINRRRLIQSTALGAGAATMGISSILASGTAPAKVSRVSSSQETQKVRALVWSNGPTIDGHFESRFKAFNEAHSGSIEVDLQFLPWDQYWQKLQLGYSSGDVYDVYFWDVQAYGHYKRDLLLNLQPMIDATDLLDSAKYPTALFEPWKLDGTNMFAVPENLQTIALYYNKALFDADGLAVPDDTWNYDQIVEAATAMTKREGDRVNQWGMNVGNLGVWWGTQTLSWARGDAFFDKVLEPTKFQFSNSANVEALDFVRSLVNDHKVAPTPAVSAESGDTTGFQFGRIGLVVEGSWQISAFAELPFEWGVTSIPMVGTSRVPAYFMGGWVIAKDSKVPEAAFEWARWSSSDYQQVMATEHDWLPIQNEVRASAATTDGLPEGYRAVIDSLETARIGDVYSSNTQQIWVEVFEPKMTEMMNDNKPASEIAVQIDEGANALLEG